MINFELACLSPYPCQPSKFKSHKKNSNSEHLLTKWRAQIIPGFSMRKNKSTGSSNSIHLLRYCHSNSTTTDSNYWKLAHRNILVTKFGAPLNTWHPIPCVSIQIDICTQILLKVWFISSEGSKPLKLMFGCSQSTMGVCHKNLFRFSLQYFGHSVQL